MEKPQIKYSVQYVAVNVWLPVSFVMFRNNTGRGVYRSRNIERRNVSYDVFSNAG